MMKSFRFRLQKVLELRARAEKETAARLADARCRAEAASRAVESLAAARRATVERADTVRIEGVTAGELQSISLLVQQLDRHLEAAIEAANSADEQVDHMTAEFQTAMNRRRVFDRLREKHLESWRTERERRERAAMDAIALARHARRREEA